MFDKSAIQELSQAQAITAANDVDNSSLFVALPSDFKIHDLEQFDACRRRARGNMQTTLIDGFAAYIQSHSEPGATVFAKGIDNGRMTATAVLNLGTVDGPGHADNTSTLAIQRTAAYAALESRTVSGLTQKEAAEFIQDWASCIECFGANSEDDESAPIQTKHAVAALRALTIKKAEDRTTVDKNLGASQSTFQSVDATSKSTIPTLLYFKCVPFLGLPSRQFTIRLGILTGEDTPKIRLRIIQAELHAEEMTKEFSALLAEKVTIPVIEGHYTVAK
jgi:uncharacterized protein YfdQ (DUF2303 family)